MLRIKDTLICLTTAIRDAVKIYLFVNLIYTSAILNCNVYKLYILFSYHYGNFTLLYTIHICILINETYSEINIPYPYPYIHVHAKHHRG